MIFNNDKAYKPSSTYMDMYMKHRHLYSAASNNNYNNKPVEAPAKKITNIDIYNDVSKQNNKNNKDFYHQMKNKNNSTSKDFKFY